MNIYEVIFFGSRGVADAEDTIYLVRAADFRAALGEVQRNGAPSKYNGTGSSSADIVHEIGLDLSPFADANPCILRGPYFAFGHNFGWKSWQKKNKTAKDQDEWEEQKSD